MILIWGWRALHKVLGRGEFACPACSVDSAYTHKQARRWFTLFFIPVLPLKVLGEYVECDRCKRAYDPAVLTSPTNSALGDQLLAAVREGLVLVVGTDPSPTARRGAIEMISDFAGRTWTEAELDHDLAVIDGTHLSARLLALSSVLSEQGKERLVGGFATVAATGGVIEPAARSAIERIAAEIGMTSAHTRGVIDEALERV
jgi:hypothetical protein